MRAVLCSLLVFATSANALTRSEVEEALKKATTFFDQKVRFHGGFVWHVSSDLKYREGEGRADDKNWVQPPGTPSVGEAFLEAYAATKDPAYLKMAEKTGEHLIGGQLESGGMDYNIEVEPTNRHT